MPRQTPAEVITEWTLYYTDVQDAIRRERESCLRRARANCGHEPGTIGWLFPL